MPDREDRFGDLGGPDPADERSAADKLADLDERDPEPDDPRRRPAGPPEPARPGGRYMWVVGVAAMILVTVVLVNQARNAREGRFIDGPEVGRPLPEFAAPLIDGPEADPNLVPRSADTDDTKACEVRVPGSLNICDQWDKPVVLSFLFLRGADCEPYFDKLERVRREFGDRVNFIGVFFERDRDEAREVVEKHDWNFPIVHDREGSLVNSYAVGGCPTTVFAGAGGRVRETRKADLSERELQALVGRLVR